MNKLLAKLLCEIDQNGAHCISKNPYFISTYLCTCYLYVRTFHQSTQNCCTYCAGSQGAQMSRTDSVVRRLTSHLSEQTDRQAFWNNYGYDLCRHI